MIAKSMTLLAAVFVTVFASSCTDQLSSVAPITDELSSASLYNSDAIANTLIDDHGIDMYAKGGRGPGRGRGPGSGDDHGRDSLGGGNSGRDSLGGPHRGDSTRPNRPDLRGVIDCLKLTTEQMAQLTAIVQAKHDCEQAAKDAFKAAVEPIRTQEKALFESLKAQVKAGTITRTDAQAQMKSFKDANAEAMKAAVDAMKAAIQSCNDIFLRSIERILTPEQLLLWNQWKTTGVNPCDTTGGGVING